MANNYLTTVAIGGKMDPIHDGHIDNIIKASKLGKYLFVMLNTDEAVAKYSVKKFCAIPWDYRALMIRGLMYYLHIQGEIVKTIDGDDLCADTLEMLHPTIFAKGGDRTPNNMPQKELDVCERLKIEVVYGVGDLLNSSSRIGILIKEAGLDFHHL